MGLYGFAERHQRGSPDREEEEGAQEAEETAEESREGEGEEEKGASQEKKKKKKIKRGLPCLPQHTPPVHTHITGLPSPAPALLLVLGAPGSVCGH